MRTMRTIYHMMGAQTPKELRGTKDVFLSALVPRELKGCPFSLSCLPTKSVKVFACHPTNTSH